MKQLLEQRMIEKAIVLISKRDDIEVSSIAWTDGIQVKKTNILSGFEASGIWPLNFTKLQEILKLCQHGGVDSTKTVRFYFPHWQLTELSNEAKH